jgi:hypothetical protein
MQQKESKSVVTKKIKEGLRVLSFKDGYLLGNNIHERSIVHKLANHLEAIFFEWDIDCEYNRNLGNKKELVIEPKAILREIIRNLGDKRFIDKISKGEEFSEKDFNELLTLLNQKLESDYKDVVSFYIAENGMESVFVSVYPDIIIHKRGKKDNYAIIECKNSANKNNKKARIFDLVKLYTFMKSVDFGYKYAYFIDIPTGNDYEEVVNFNHTEFLGVIKIKKKI